MIHSRKWTAIERLDPAPGVAVMTSRGYYIDGEFHPTNDRSPKGRDRNGHGSRERVHVVAARKPSLFKRIWGGGRG